MGSITDKLLKQRVDTPTIGKWSSGFSKCKKLADSKQKPLISVWTNGDACGHCVDLEKVMLSQTFTNWMGQSGCYFWVGTCKDKTKDDKIYGTGYLWIQNKYKLPLFPLVRVWWKKGKVDTANSGTWWIGDVKSKWKSTFIKKLNNLLKNYEVLPEIDDVEDPIEETDYGSEEYTLPPTGDDSTPDESSQSIEIDPEDEEARKLQVQFNLMNSTQYLPRVQPISNFMEQWDGAVQDGNDAILDV